MTRSRGCGFAAIPNQEHELYRIRGDLLRALEALVDQMVDQILDGLLHRRAVTDRRDRRGGRVIAGREPARIPRAAGRHAPFPFAGRSVLTSAGERPQGVV
jgi:hypothetical protein